MKIEFRNTKGITLIALVITIVLLIILASISIGSLTGARSSIKTSNSNLKLAELSEVQQIVLETYVKYQQLKNSSLLEGTQITYSEATEYAREVSSSISLQASDYDSNTSVDVSEVYYELSPTNLDNLGIEGAEDTYIVNYSTGEVFNYTYKETADGEILYISVD